ncbi:sugar phosphate isomerase/epimerase family protein [Hydrogenophaga crocea]|uniref:Sugar phosphate isomerase/epimerase n=1 Tax=Hydrogenophaga crocea TaxID=2716225 RepID=A0A6G8IM59_9BURK|nr:TIM barrel protein [Hydrogenophaga crocea]QIM54264.1 sugar phosphate isomerase/epimerase [Hydrogenophaga crocea]
MAHPLCLAHLSVLQLSPPQVVETAAAAGFGLLGLRLAAAMPGQAVFPMLGRSPLMRETLARLDALGVAVHDVELVGLREDSVAADHEALFEAAARLGARHVLVAGDGHDEARLAERFAELAVLGRRYGLRMGLEFMPWRGVRNLASAQRVLALAAEAGGGLIVDAIHLDRSGDGAGALAAIPAAQWSYFQICDAPAQRPSDEAELLRQAREARLVPGEGGLDLRGMLRALPEGLVVSVEAPLADARSPLDKARALHRGARALLEAVGRS